MIRINENWIVDVDEYNYTLKRDMHKTRTIKQKDGSTKEEEVYNTQGHFSSLDKALNRLGEEMVRERLKVPEIDLNTAVQAIRECTEEWRQLVEKVT